jgi:hypothetical protein
VFALSTCPARHLRTELPTADTLAPKTLDAITRFDEASV